MHQEIREFFEKSLCGPITNDNEDMYLVKDAQSKNGNGAIVVAIIGKTFRQLRDQNNGLFADVIDPILDDELIFFFKGRHYKEEDMLRLVNLRSFL